MKPEMGGCGMGVGGRKFLLLELCYGLGFVFGGLKGSNAVKAYCTAN